MQAGIHMRTVYEDDGLLELSVFASNGVFSGRTHVWVDVEALDALTAGLKGFPATVRDCREYELGTFRDDLAGGGLSMRFYCTNRVGHPAIEVRLQTNGSSEGVASAMFHIPVTASEIDRFVQQLAALLGGLREEASLEMALH